MGLGANLAGIAAKGLVGTVFNGILGNNNKLEDQEELMLVAFVPAGICTVTWFPSHDTTEHL